MSTCQQLPMVHAYHDGQLPARQAAAVERHVEQCPVCAAELAWLGEVRRQMLAAASMSMPRDVMTGLQRRLAREPYRPALRLAWRLTAAAAVVLLACLPRLAGSHAGVTAAPPAAWEIAALSPGAEFGLATEEQVLARWIADDLALASSARGGAGVR